MLWLLSIIFRVGVKAASSIYGGEGINIPLMLMPTRLIAQTLRDYGAQIGERVRFLSPLTIHNSHIESSDYYKNLSVGDDCYFGRELFLDLQDRIIIESNVTISHRVMIMTHTDAGTSPLKDTVIPTIQAPVIIRNGAYVGAQVTILQGVEVGEGSVVGAGALVVKPVAPNTVVVGVPAKEIKSLRTVQANAKAQSHK